jgi:dTDP-D-glucose 4,6-dehydratase
VAKILVTGGAGFIGTAVVRQLLGEGEQVVNLDKLTYAGSNPALGALGEGGCYALEVADVADAAAVARIFAQHRPDAVMHLAAETHVDRSTIRANSSIRISSALSRCSKRRGGIGARSMTRRRRGSVSI